MFVTSFVSARLKILPIGIQGNLLKEIAINKQTAATFCHFFAILPGLFYDYSGVAVSTYSKMHGLMGSYAIKLSTTQDVIEKLTDCARAPISSTIRS